jgi:5-methylcytosine-specific restriction endonuclease McrA
MVMKKKKEVDKTTKSYLLKQDRIALKKKDMEWSAKIKERDGYKCVICDSTVQLNSHHIIPREEKLTRHDLMDGITCCILHHKFSLKCSCHKNSFAFLIWLMEHRPEQYNYLKEKQKEINSRL